MRQLSALAFFLLSLALPAVAQDRDPSRYSRVLLPFHTQVWTADGIWMVSWWIRNDGDRPVDVFPLAAGGGFVPEEFAHHVHIAGYPSVGPNSTPKYIAGDVINVPFSARFNPVQTKRVGAFFYVETSGKSDISIAGSIRFRFAGVETAATPLQAIPESSFLYSRRSIVGIPHNSGARYDLRVYALPETVTKSAVTVRIYDVQANDFDGPYAADRLLREQVVNLASAEASLPPCFDSCGVPAVELAPAAAEVIDLFDPNQPLGPHTFRVEIEPASSDTRWWAVLSTMDRATRQVSLFQPSF